MKQIINNLPFFIGVLAITVFFVLNTSNNEVSPKPTYEVKTAYTQDTSPSSAFKDWDYCGLDSIICNSSESKTAYITKYKWTGYRMASGKYPYIGAVATSDRSIPFGTKIEIDGKEYIVEDRTALWVHERQGLTIDIYSEDSKKDILVFGKQYKKIFIIQ